MTLPWAVVARFAMRLCFALLILLCQAGIEALAIGDHVGIVRIKGVNRYYRLHLPALGSCVVPDCGQGEADGRKGKFGSCQDNEGCPATSYSGKRPLVIVLHGGGQNSWLAAWITRMNEVSDREGFAVAYPDGSGRFRRLLLTWNAFDCCGFSSRRGVDDVGFIRELIDKLVNEHGFDPERVYVAGFSNGGMLAHRIGCELSGKVAAIAAIGGSMSGREPPPQTAVPALIIHGTDDCHVPYYGGKGKTARWGYPVNDRPVSYAVNFWRKACHCADEAEDDKRGRELWQRFRGVGDAEVVVCTIEGGRHAWPGGRKVLFYTDNPYRGFNASRECWRFFASHRRGEDPTGVQATRRSGPAAVRPQATRMWDPARR